MRLFVRIWFPVSIVLAVMSGLFVFTSGLTWLFPLVAWLVCVWLYSPRGYVGSYWR